MERIINLSDLEPLKKHATAYGQHGEDYIVCRTSRLFEDIGIEGPVRIVGLSLCLLRKGEITCEIDFKQFRVTAPALISYGGKFVFHNTSVEQIEADCLFVSPQCMHDLSIDLSVIDLHDMIDKPPEPVTSSISDGDIEVFSNYFRLLYRNAVDGNEIAFSKNIARSILQALFYQLLQFHSKSYPRTSAHKDEGSQARQVSYVHDFMRLLQIHHKIHRSIAFYAEQLCISPKYLSHIIKEATGRSATEWIAEFVVMEAKNMLRYSHKNIQQVAYELNFTTQSSFGKYFKHVTGMSPTEFQKS